MNEYIKKVRAATVARKLPMHSRFVLPTSHHKKKCITCPLLQMREVPVEKATAAALQSLE